MSLKYLGLSLLFLPFFTTLRPWALHSSACRHRGDSGHVTTLYTKKGHLLYKLLNEESLGLLTLP